MCQLMKSRCLQGSMQSHSCLSSSLKLLSLAIIVELSFDLAQTSSLIAVTRFRNGQCTVLLACLWEDRLIEVTFSQGC